MSERGRDNSLDCLFTGQNGKIENIKFFRGTDELISPENLRSEFVDSVKRSRSARENGEASVIPKTRKKPLDLRKFVADMT